VTRQPPSTAGLLCPDATSDSAAEAVSTTLTSKACQCPMYERNRNKP